MWLASHNSWSLHVSFLPLHDTFRVCLLSLQLHLDFEMLMFDEQVEGFK